MNLYHRAAINAANKVRRALGKEPVDHLYAGTPATGWNCPITETIYNDSPDLRERFLVFTNRHQVFIWDKESVLSEYGEGAEFVVENGILSIATPDDDPDDYARIADELDVVTGAGAVHKFDLSDTAQEFVKFFDRLDFNYDRVGVEPEWLDLIKKAE